MQQSCASGVPVWHKINSQHAGNYTYIYLEKKSKLVLFWYLWEKIEKSGKLEQSPVIHGHVWTKPRLDFQDAGVSRNSGTAGS